MRKLVLLNCVMAFGIAAFAGLAMASEVSVTARIEPDVVPVGGEATLVVTVEGKFRKTTNPELPPLDEFYVNHAGTSQNFSIVNGVINSSLQFNYILVPRKEGTFTIQPVRFQVGDREYRSEPLKIEVVRAPAQIPKAAPGTVESDESIREDRNVFVRASVDRDTVYVNQQVTWKLGFYTDGRVNFLSSPNYTPPTAEGFWVEDLPPQRKYYKRIGGREYLVNEITRAYFPTAPGSYTIGNARVDVVVDNFGRDIFEDFFNRGRTAFGLGRPATLTTDAIMITVLPLPGKGKPAHFSGIVGENVELSLRTDKQVALVGEPINVSMEITGDGNVKTMVAPSLPELSGFKNYEAGTSSDLFKREYTVSGRKKYDYVLVPKTEGVKVIPPIKVSFFDPEAEIYKTASSSPVRLEIKPGTPEGGRRIIYAGAGEEIEVLGRDVRYIHSVPAALGTGDRKLYENKFFIAFHVVPLIAVLASLVGGSRRRRWREAGPLARSLRAAREAEKKLREAATLRKQGRDGEAFASITGALNGYFADKMNVSPSGLTWADIDQFLSSKQATEADRDQIRNLFEACDAARFSPAVTDAERCADAQAEAARIVKLFEKRYSR